MPHAERSFELEVNRAKTIVRVHCVKDPPENAAVFVGKRLDTVLKWDTAPTGGMVEGTLAGRGPCHFTVSRVGEFVLFIVHWQSEECLLDCRGSVATLERTIEVVEQFKDEACTLMVGAYDYSRQNVMGEAPTNAALRLLLRNLNEPRTLVSYSSTDLFAAMPKLPPQELEMRVQMFYADCRVEFADKHRWNFGAKSLDPPFHFTTNYAACREQAVKGVLFAPEDLRNAG